MNAPPLTTVAQELWRDIDAPAAAELRPEARVSVLVEGGPPAPALAQALAAQAYPGELVEVAELGSGEPQGDVVVVVPADAAPDPGFIAAHARWHHVAGGIVSLGPLEAGEEEPLDLVRTVTRDLTDLGGGYHLAAAAGTFATSRELLARAGGAGPVAAGLGGLDLLYRLHSAGAVFVAEPGARASAATARGLAVAAAAAFGSGEPLAYDLPRAAQLVPLFPFREIAAARRYERPAVAVNVDVGDAPAGEAIATIGEVLAGHLGDLELRVRCEREEPAYAGVAAAVAADPRARLAPSSLADEATRAAFQVTVPPAAMLDPRTLADLHELIAAEAVAALHVTVPGAAPQDAMIDVVATAAWNRARALAAAGPDPPEQIVGRLFGERWVSGVEVSTRKHGVTEPQVTEHGPLAAATDLRHERVTHLKFRDRANEMERSTELLARRTIAERLRAREIRRAAERAEARLPGA